MINNRIINTLSVAPGCGKTIAGLAHAKLLISLNKIDFVVVGAPLTTIKSSWGRDAKKYFKLNFAHEISNSRLWHLKIGAPKDLDGIICTYAQMARSIDMYKTLLMNKRVCLIADEIHHLAEENTWGAAIDDIFSRAVCIVALSGTPWRSDGNAIPFLNYDENGALKSDFEYNYLDGLRDGHLRIINFHPYDGQHSWRVNSEIISKNFQDELNKHEQSQILRTALLTNNGLVDSMILDADRVLSTQSSKFPAKGLIVAIDQSHARDLAKRVFRLTGHKPFVATSENIKTSKQLDAFSENTSIRYAVTCKKISEGFDDKFLTTLVYASNIKQRLFFDQTVGRVVRKLNKISTENQVANIFFPAHPLLTSYAEDYEKQKDIYLSTKSEGLERIGYDVERTSSFHPLSSEGRKMDTIVKDLKLIENTQKENIENVSEIVAGIDVNDISWDEEIRLRSGLCNKMINRIALHTGENQREVNYRFFEAGGKRVNASSLDDIKYKQSWLESEIKKLGII